MTSFEEIKAYFVQSIQDEKFIKLTLSKPYAFEKELKNVYLRLVLIKNEVQVSFQFRYQTKDVTKNYSIEEAADEILKLLENRLMILSFFTTEEDVVIKLSKKKKLSHNRSASTLSKKNDLVHDHVKTKAIGSESVFLHKLGVTDLQGKVIPKMADKFRQINRYIEIFEGLLKDITLPESPLIVDMGAGKGYLTFALYDFLTQNGFTPKVVGVELREELVEFCNKTAQEVGFQDLKFVCNPIANFEESKIDVLIALHACDTATDDALSVALKANADLIVTAPCCHKQVRQSVEKLPTNNPLLEYGIFQERQFEMVTDTIRALYLQKLGYETKIFEFVSNEHTRKNIMLTGTKTSTSRPEIQSSIDKLKSSYNLKQHYLEKLL